MNRTALAAILLTTAVQLGCSNSGSSGETDAAVTDTGTTADTGTDVPAATDRPDVQVTVDVPVIDASVDVPLAIDVVDVPPAIDVVDVPPAIDVVDVPPAIDAVDVVDVVDVPPAVDVVDVPPAIDVVDVPDVPDVVDVPPDLGSCGSGPACSAGTSCCSGACVDLMTSADHCGACGTRCVLAEATAVCASARCAVSACTAGHADCDGNAANGCEVTLGSDDAHCGSCTTTCSAGTTCGRGSCVPSAGLVAWYRFDGDLTESVASATAGAIGGVTYGADRFGRASSAGSFDGAAYGLALANARLPVGASPRTLAIWMRTAATFSAEAGALANWGVTASGQRFGLLTEPATNRAYFVGEGNDLSGTTALNDDRWHFVAVTYDGATLRLYVDAVEQASGPKALATGNTVLVIGRAVMDHYPGRPVPELFRGLLDDLRVYDRALTAAQIAALRDEGAVP